jgi:glucose 1-dehydrogenase
MTQRALRRARDLLQRSAPEHVNSVGAADMKAVAIEPESGSTDIRQVGKPDLEEPESVLVRMLEVGVCGTDSGICEGGKGSAPDGEDFLIPGHEGFGEVVEVGSGVTGLKPGDLVVPTVRRACPHDHCTACRTGNNDFCMTGDYTERGIEGMHGFASEFIVEDEEHLCRVPPAVRDVAVLAEPLSIAEKGVRQYLAIQRRLPWLKDADDATILCDSRTVVLGGGPIGLLGCLLMRLHGAPVIVYSRDRPPAPEVDVTEAVGGSYISSEDEEFDVVVERLGGVDFVYEGTGAAELMFEVLPAMSRNGVFMATGVPGTGGKTEIAADTVMNELVLGNQVLCGTVNASNADFAAAVQHLGEMLERWPDAVRSIITHRHEPSEFCESAGSSDGLKHIIDYSGN